MKRHYCYNCKKKKEERFMRPVGIQVNNRMRWVCLDCDEEHRRYGRKWH